jgi:hypothetical protein
VDSKEAVIHNSSSNNNNNQAMPLILNMGQVV